jgi:hypothetical protein
VLKAEFHEYGHLFSVMFSPVEPRLIAAAGSGGTLLYDIRHNKIKYSNCNRINFNS